MDVLKKINPLVDHFRVYPSTLKASYERLSKQFGLNEEEIALAKQVYRNKLADGPVAFTHEFFEREVSTDFDKGEIKVSVSVENEIGSEDLFRFFRVDESKYSIKQFWSIYKNGRFHVSALFQKKKEEVNYKKAFEEFVSSYKFEKVTHEKSDEERDICAVMCLFDLHLGKYSEENYTGTKTFMATQVASFQRSLNELLSNLPEDRLDMVILPIGNDFFNIDDSRITTTAGTPQDNTKDLYSLFSNGLSLLVDAINRLSFTNVYVTFVPSNHDEVSSMHLCVALKQIFLGNDKVQIDDTPLDRKYIQYGTTLIGLSHGELKPEKYAALMPFEAKSKFATSKQYEFLLGHIHHERIKHSLVEQDGVVIRYLSALAGTDRWHYKNGYTLSKRRAYAICYHKTKGRIMEYIHTEG